MPPYPGQSEMAYIEGNAVTGPRTSGGSGSSAGGGRSEFQGAGQSAPRPTPADPSRGPPTRSAERAGSAAAQAAVRHDRGDRHEQGRDPLAHRARRDAGRHQEPSVAQGLEHSAHGPGRLAGHARHEDAADRGRAALHDHAGRRARRDAARLRQGDGPRGRRGVHAGAAERLADDVPTRRRAVPRGRDQRRAVLRASCSR